MEENNVKVAKFVCPICGEEFANVHDYARHITWHSTVDKKKAEEEEKKRLEDQKKYDAAKLEKLYKVYENAAEEYSKAKEEYYKKYKEPYSGTSLFDALKEISDMFADDPWHYRLRDRI